MKIKSAIIFTNKSVILFTIAFLISSCAMFASKIEEEEITFFNGNLKFGGTLTIPSGKGKFPLVILISGSGQQNRDEEIMGFKPFAEIAMYLSSAGYAVFRYDDRGVGASKNSPADLENATMNDFAKDAFAAFRTLQSHSKIYSNKIGLLGHSEGGLIAQKLAAEYPSEIKFIILMAAPTISGAQISRLQVEQMNKEAGLSNAAIDTVLKYQDMIAEAIISDKSEKELKEILYQTNLKITNYLPEEKKKFITDAEKYAKAQAEQMFKMLNTPYIKEHFRYDPVNALKNIQCPTLAIFGERDMQVPMRLNISPLEYAFFGREKLIEIVTIPSANHLFQKANTGFVTEYNKLEKEFEESFLPTIEKWLNKIFK